MDWVIEGRTIWTITRPVAPKTRQDVDGHCYSEWKRRRYGWPFVYNGPGPGRTRSGRRTRLSGAGRRPRRSAWTNTVLRPPDHVGSRSMTPKTHEADPSTVGGPTTRPPARCRLWIAMLITHSWTPMETRRRKRNGRKATSRRSMDAEPYMLHGASPARWICSVYTAL